MTPKTADILKALAAAGEEPLVFRCTAVAYESAAELVDLNRDVAMDESGCITLDARGRASRETLRALAARLLEKAHQLS